MKISYFIQQNPRKVLSSHLTLLDAQHNQNCYEFGVIIRMVKATTYI